ncbi:hypothetical protein [Winogradskyella wichelsiae]|uniref:hypothetical protein n=1 Tax=Winogradskyella wichelsiae TaxID=2697007 RepID=UPI003EF80F2D
MKSILNLLGAFLICTTTCFAQVGIGTETPDASSILELQSTEGGLLLPRLTTEQRDAILTPAEGLTIYNTTTQVLEIYTDSWNSLTAEAGGTPSLTMHRDLGGTAITAGAAFYNFPLGTDDITENDTEYFNVVSDGEIEVLKAGSYLINASWAVRNLEAGNKKYILAIFQNGTRVGYMARGFSSLPSPSSDYFGASGTFQYVFDAGDIIDIQYYILSTSSTLRGDLMHIGMVKL